MKHSGTVVDKIEGFKVIECKQCQFKHVNPIPTDEELEKLYAAEFYSAKKKNYFKDSEADLEWWREVYGNHFELIKKWTKKRKLLDIGSGPGYFIKSGQDCGFEVTGLEPSIEAVRYAKKLGVKVINDFFSSQTVKKLGRFDIVSMNLVLEHIPDPETFLKNVNQILKPGGILFIISPNDYNPFQNILKEKMKFDPWWVSPMQHINYFNFDSITKLLKKVGFKKLDASATYPMELFLLSGENYVGKRSLGRKCHSKRKNLEINLLQNNPDLFNHFYHSLAKNGLGREFIIIARKQ